MYRKIMEYLKKWKESKYRKPLILQGARQVGKTYTVLEFGRECSCTVEKHKTWIASPATIPKSGERNRKIHSCMLYLISI